MRGASWGVSRLSKGQLISSQHEAKHTECQGPGWFSCCNTAFTRVVKYDFNKKQDSVTATVRKSPTWYAGHSDSTLRTHVARAVAWCALASSPRSRGGRGASVWCPHFPPALGFFSNSPKWFLKNAN